MNSPVDCAVQHNSNFGEITPAPATLIPSHGRGVLRPFQKGHGGRPKGSLSGWSKRALRSVEKVFLNLGGTEFMTEWARENPSDFFRVWMRLLPSQYTVDQRHRLQSEPAQLTDEDLLRVIALATRPAVLDWAADQAKDELALEPEPAPKPAPEPKQPETEAQLRERLGLPPGPPPWTIVE